MSVASQAEGPPISDLMARALANPELISLAAGFVDQQTLPVEPTRQAVDALLRDRPSALDALQYGTTPGDPVLRTWLLEELVQRDLQGDRGSLELDQVVITAGSNQLLHLLCVALLQPGDIVLCASPTYLVFMGTALSVGARTVGVAVDRHGIIPEALNEALLMLQRQGELPRVKAIYLVPYFDNPCGLTMSVARREAIVELAKRWSLEHPIYVISDDAYRELHYDTPDVPGLRAFDETGETVIVTGTFSKSFSPGIRIGWGVLPKSVVAPVCNHKGNIDFGSPNFNQQLMRRVLEMGLYEPHIDAIRREYRQKLHAMLEAADRYLAPISGTSWIPPTGGLYLWLELPPDIPTGPSGPLLDLAIRKGMFYVPVQFCFPEEGEPVRENTIRLSFGAASCSGIRQGVRLLAESIQEVMEQARR
jgi:2-aminoadipate transaminase